jgi:hypothetical protein
MANRSFIVVPFEERPDSVLSPAVPMRVQTKVYAHRLAAQATPHYAGLAILEQPADEFEEPRLVRVIGRVPDSLSGLPLDKSPSRFRSAKPPSDSGTALVLAHLAPAYLA